MSSEKITFKNSSGDNLIAKLELPIDQKPLAYAIFAHCFTCNKNLTVVRNIARALNQNGIAVMRFDFTGLGQSEGEFADTNFSSNVDDLIQAANFLTENHEAPSLMIGHSLGGAAAIFAASKLDSVKALATIGAPSDPAHVAHLVESGQAEIEAHGVANVNIGGRSFAIKKQFLEDIQQQDLPSVLSKMRKAILVMHSPQDAVVDIKNAQRLYSKAFHPKSFISLDGADHLLTKKEDSLYAGNLIANWAVRYLNLEAKKELRTSKQVLAQINAEPGFTTRIKAGQHSLIADEPLSVGGNDYGPTPYDLLLSGLGACTAMTLKMYAGRKKWDLQEVEVHMEHGKTHAQDCEACETTKGKIDRIEKEIILTGDLDETQRKRLLEIADRCPVHRTLHSEVLITTKEVKV